MITDLPLFLVLLLLLVPFDLDLALFLDPDLGLLDGLHIVLDALHPGQSQKDLTLG